MLGAGVDEWWSWENVPTPTILSNTYPDIDWEDLVPYITAAAAVGGFSLFGMSFWKKLKVLVGLDTGDTTNSKTRNGPLPPKKVTSKLIYSRAENAWKDSHGDVAHEHWEEVGNTLEKVTVGLTPVRKVKLTIPRINPDLNVVLTMVNNAGQPIQDDEQEMAGSSQMSPDPMCTRAAQPAPSSQQKPKRNPIKSSLQPTALDNDISRRNSKSSSSSSSSDGRKKKRKGRK
eukprot:CFRG6034T1